MCRSTGNVPVPPTTEFPFQLWTKYDEHVLNMLEKFAHFIDCFVFFIPKQPLILIFAYSVNKLRLYGINKT